MDEPSKINADGTITVYKDADVRKTIDLIITKLEKKASNYYHLFSYQLKEGKNPIILTTALNTLGDLIPKLAELYLVKAAHIYNTHLNPYIGHMHLNPDITEKSEKEYKKETDLSIKLIDTVMNLDPNTRLKKEYMISQIEPCLPNKDKQAYGHQVALQFHESIIEFVNNLIETDLIFNRIDKKLGLSEKLKPYMTKKS